MTEIDLLQAVAQVGFPIAVASYLLWKVTDKLQQISDSQAVIVEKLTLIADKVK